MLDPVNLDNHKSTLKITLYIYLLFEFFFLNNYILNKLYCLKLTFVRKMTSKKYKKVFQNIFWFRSPNWKVLGTPLLILLLMWLVMIWIYRGIHSPMVSMKKIKIIIYNILKYFFLEMLVSYNRYIKISYELLYFCSHFKRYASYNIEQVLIQNKYICYIFWQTLS